MDANKTKTDKNENEKEIIKRIDAIDIIKKDKKILKNILKYLKDDEIIIFTSCNNYLDKERISFLDNKKEELLQIINLDKDETMESKINKIKKQFPEESLSHTQKEFLPSEEAKNKLKQLNNNDNQQIYKNILDNINKDIDINLFQSREIKNVEIIPTCSAHIIKALKEPKRQRKKEKGAVFKHTGNLTFEQIKTIAKAMQPKSLSRELKGTVKEVLGTCVAVGITVDGKSPKDVQKEVDAGKLKI